MSAAAAATALPRLLYGTAWKKERTAALVERAVSAGFRAIDTACQPKHYDEVGVGEGLARCMARGLARRDLYLQTKFTPRGGQDPRRIPYDPRAPVDKQIEQSCEASLKNLRVLSLDALLLHSPLPSLAQTLGAWRAMEGLVERGAVRWLGISNCYEPSTFEALWRDAEIKPAVLQNRLYADTGYDRALRRFCRSHGVRYQSFWTLTANPHLLAHPSVQRLATAYGVTPAQLFFRALTLLDIAPLTGTCSDLHMKQDLAIFDFSIEPAELAEVGALLDSPG